MCILLFAGCAREGSEMGDGCVESDLEGPCVALELRQDEASLQAG